MRAEWLVVTGCFCLGVALIEAWCLTAVRNLHVAALKRIFPDSQQLLRSHIDYLMMTGLLFVSYLMFRQFGIVPPGVLVAAACAGSIINPGAFLAMAIAPQLGKKPPALFGGIVSVSFVLTTSGYLGSGWLIARAALAAG
ncbi:MAG TPA: hypothetical protein VMS22_10050 [Candidatus Eisenbacteria bacterium]|nr:hypothetical protein [Candidatus Eisenbacteria bacterium]